MTESTDKTAEETSSTEDQVPEIELLRERADDLGIKYTKATKVETLRKKVNDKLEGNSDDDSSDDDDDQDSAPSQKSETAAQKKLRKKREAEKMVRIRVTCMNPNKRGYTGEYFGAGNSSVPTMNRFVQFDVPWHVPYILFRMIKARKVQVFVNKRVDGKSVKVPKLIPEYSVEELAPLTEAELKKLSLEQARRSGNSEE